MYELKAQLGQQLAHSQTFDRGVQMSLKTGIEHRFSLTEFGSTVELHVLLGKTKEFYGIFKCNLKNIHVDQDVFLYIFGEKTNQNLNKIF